MYHHHHILCSLFVRGLTAILLSGGLGVEDQPIDLCEFLILLHVIYFFMGLKNRKSSDQPQEHSMN